MCWLRQSLLHQKPLITSAFTPAQSQKDISLQSSTQISCKIQHQENSKLAEILHQLILSNSQAIQYSNQKLRQTNNILQNMSKEVQFLQTQHQKKQIQMKTLEIGTIPSFLQQMFGKKPYQYKLKLVHEIPKTLYKERNFNFEIQLLDSQGNLVKNGNPIPIYFGVCTKQGEWLHENRNGQNLIKGKNEIQLYQGKASFQKIYLRQVSKPYLNGKFKFVIYPKASMVKFTTCGMSEKKVDPEKIMPVAVDNITVLAKKREKC